MHSFSGSSSTTLLVLNLYFLLTTVVPAFRYSRSTHCFQRVDKYVGRSVDVDKFEELLAAFFTVGGVLQGDVICSVIEQEKSSFYKLILKYF
jgi:hypothetical protein